MFVDNVIANYFVTIEALVSEDDPNPPSTRTEMAPSIGQPDIICSSLNQSCNDQQKCGFI